MRKLLAIFGLLLAAQVSAQDLSSGLILHLPLDEGTGTSATDEAGNYTCTLDAESWDTGDATYGNVYVSSATNEISCGSVSVPISTAATWAFWMKETSEPSANNYVITKYNTATNARQFRVYTNTSDQIVLQVSSDGANNEVQLSTASSADSTWQHIIVTFSSGTYLVYYDNSVQTVDADFTTHTSMFDSTTNSVFCIGSVNCANIQGFVGSLRHVAIWDRVLSSAERALVFADSWSAAPSFTAGPTITPATDGYTIGGTVDIDATVYAVACALNSTAPTIAQVKAGDCTGDVDALIAANEAWTGTSADTFALTASNSLPLHDVYVVASAAGGDSTLQTFADEDRSPCTGCAIQVTTSISSTAADTNGICFVDYVDPDCAAGDIIEYDTTSNNTHTVSFAADGDFEVDAGGDTSQDYFDYCLQDASTGVAFTTPSCWGGTFDRLWLNNTAPNVTEVGGIIIWDIDEAIIELDRRTYIGDGDGDTLTFTDDCTMPTGITESGDGDALSNGTPTVEDETGVVCVVTGTDPPGASANTTFTFFVIDTWTMPDCTDDTVSACITAVEAAAPWYEDVTSAVSATFACSETVAENDIISQTPTESSEVDDPLQAISVVVSLGETTPGCLSLPGKSNAVGIQGTDMNPALYRTY